MVPPIAIGARGGAEKPEAKALGFFVPKIEGLYFTGMKGSKNLENLIRYPEITEKLKSQNKVE